MATAKQITALARKVMMEGAVVIPAADYDADGGLTRVQVYFWDEHEAVMDIIEKRDLVENWPDEGVYVIDDAGGEHDCLKKARIVDGEEDFYIRIDEADETRDDLGHIPSVILLEAVEAVSQLKESKLK